MHYLPKEPFVIISANTQVQHWRDATLQGFNLKQKLTEAGFIFKTVQGRFKGKTETSFYIPWLDTPTALDIAKDFGQESILVVDHLRNAWLYYTDGDMPKYLGLFVKGDDDDNYTIADGIKYICTKDLKMENCV
jgi:hypothetical protein